MQGLNSFSTEYQDHFSDYLAISATLNLFKREVNEELANLEHIKEETRAILKANQALITYKDELKVFKKALYDSTSSKTPNLETLCSLDSVMPSD